MKKSCPVCTSELSRKWQTPSVANGHSASNVHWNCGVCGATFTRAELQPVAKLPAETRTLTASAVAPVTFTKLAAKIPAE